jgi:hypothetical protein
MSPKYIIYLANYSGGILYILAVLLLVALSVSIDRFWSFRRTIVRGQSIIRSTPGAASPAPSLGEVDQFRSAIRSAVQAVAPLPPGFAGRTYTVTVAVIFQMTMPNGE